MTKRSTIGNIAYAIAMALTGKKKAVKKTAQTTTTSTEEMLQQLIPMPEPEFYYAPMPQVMFPPIMEPMTTVPAVEPAVTTTAPCDVFVRQLMAENAAGFAGHRVSREFGRTSVHIFPVRRFGHDLIRVTIILGHEKGVDWEELDLWSKALQDRFFKQAELVGTYKRCILAKVKDYSETRITTWIPVWTEFMPDLDGKYTSTELDRRDGNLIGYVKAFEDGVMSPRSILTSPGWNGFYSKWKGITGRDCIPFIQDDYVVTENFTFSLKDNTLEDIGDILERGIYGLKFKKDGCIVYRLMDFYFHNSSRYQEGMLQYMIDPKDGTVKEYEF